MTKHDTNMVPIVILLAFKVSVSVIGMRLDLCNASLSGLYSNMAKPALSPPFSKLNGRNTGIKSLATAALGINM
jgi:hypothetical protein